MRLRTKAAGLLAGLMVLASTGSALAAGSNYQPVSGGVVKFDKYLVMDQEANVPNQTFEFTIAPAASGLADANGKLVVQSGSASAVTGSPTIAAGQAAFSTGDTTYTTVQPHVDTGTQQATQPKDNVTLGADQKYARKQVAVDFSSVKFSEPGVYRWVVTETATQKLGIDNDTDATRNLDVYVIDQNGSLTVAGYVFHNDDAFQPAKQGSAAEPARGKSPGFSNLYTTYNVTLSKTVTGNQGSRDQYFRFTVTITGDTPGTRFDVDLANADAQTLVNAYSPEAHTNPSTLTLDENGSVTQDFWLQSGQTITINGIPRAASYSVTEAPEDYRVSTSVTEGNAAAVEGTLATVEDDSLDADTVVAYTNDKTGIIATNLLTKTGPYTAVMLTGFCLLLVLAVRRRSRAQG